MPFYCNEVAQEATITARNIVQLREEHRNIIATHMSRSAGPAYQLLEYLYERPIITVNGVVNVTGLSYANANRLITKFQEHYLLRQMDTYQRNRRFGYLNYLSLFSDEKMPSNQHQQMEGSTEE
jgi:hypothetical protein